MARRLDEQLGVQVTPWADARQVVRSASLLESRVDTVFVQDQMLARNVYTLLAACAVTGCGVGTNVTWPFGRNPIEMASAAATIAELTPPGRGVTIGLGSGGALAAALVDLSGRARVVAEAIQLMKGLWAGNIVELDQFPLLAQRVRFTPGATAQLTYQVDHPPRVIVAGVGPRIVEVAVEHADGAIAAANLPMYSRRSLEIGLHGELTSSALTRRASIDPTFRLHYGINISVSRDRALARAHGRRQAALTVGNPGMWPAMERLGFDMDSVHATKSAFDEGLGVVGAADRVSASVADALVISGCIDDVIEPIASLRELASAAGYTDFFLGGPLGPDIDEATQLLVNGVIDAVWPERAP